MPLLGSQLPLELEHLALHELYLHALRLGDAEHLGLERAPVRLQAEQPLRQCAVQRGRVGQHVAGVAVFGRLD